MRGPNFGVVVFPGTNCEKDVLDVLTRVMHQNARLIWYTEKNISSLDCIVLPGGFSYGDHLRTGAMARFGPIMEEVHAFAERGRLVIGICNGFQILTEAGLLPGAFLKNDSLQFRGQRVHVRISNSRTPFTNKMRRAQVLEIPIAHGEGNYYCEEETLKQLRRRRQIVFRYCDARGRTTQEANPNGSLDNIAGIVNQRGNVLGMMPHPERVSEKILGGTDGRLIWESIIAYLKKI